MTAPITDADLARWRELAEGAPHERWVAGTPREDGTAQVYSPNRGPMRVVVPICETTAEAAPFIAEARTAVPALLDRVEALTTKCALLSASLKKQDAELAALRSRVAEVGSQ